MEVSIIIVNTNTKDLLKQTLESVFEKTQDMNFEVIVADNTSHDGSQQMVRETFPNVKLVECENRGFSYANNVGAKYANGKYLFLLNPDTILLNNAVKILADFLDNHADVGGCGGNLFDADKKPAHSYMMFLPSIKWELNILLANIPGRIQYGKNGSFNHTQKAKSTGYICGADLMIRADLFRQLNGFDTDFFVYYEESELAYRVKKAGYKMYNVPQSEIIHLEGKTFSDNERKIKIWLDSRKLYYQKTHTRFTGWLCNAIYSVAIPVQLCRYKLTGDTATYAYWKRVLKLYK